MVRKFVYKGKSIEELQQLKQEEFMELVPSRLRRSMKRGWSERQKKFLKSVREAKEGAVVKTHARDMIVLPELVGKTIAVYNGKEFKYLSIMEEMVGHYLGEFALTRKSIKHSAAGIGATRGTKFISAK